MPHLLIPATVPVASLLAYDSSIEYMVQIVCAILEAQLPGLQDGDRAQVADLIHEWTGRVITPAQLHGGIAAYMANLAWWQSRRGQAQCMLWQVMLIDDELAKLNARRSELRQQLMYEVTQHGSFTIAGVATVRLMEQRMNVHFDAKQVEQVIAELWNAGQTRFATLLEECRKWTNVPAHIQIKRT
jgi:hypothetical protein